MAKYKAVYFGPTEFEIEADNDIEAEDVAMDEASGHWVVEWIGEDDNG